jgi:TolA-binding protein
LRRSSFFWPGAAFAQTSVDARVQKLEDTIQVLERRVAALEDQLRQQAPARISSDKVNWRKLQRGVSEGDVENLLASPSKVEAFGSFTIWHYGNAAGGQVQFDNKRAVTGWREP